MGKRLLLLILLLSCSAFGCQKSPGPTATITTHTATPVPLIDAKTAFSSPEAMTKFLEQRWPLAAVQMFCIPERRHNNMYQNLVAGSDSPIVWEATLYRETLMGFDKIAWYANTKNGRATTFSLGVKRGKDYWLLEIGTEESAQQPPDYSPDPNRRWFVGHN
jgi:hypothetical protein